MDMNPSQLVDEIETLASFPEVALRVSEVLDDDRSSSADIGRIIEPDPALSAALLRLANSASYNMGARVDNVAKAIQVVGLREVRDITYAISSASAFQGIPNELISVEDFWRHSLYCACAAQHLVTKTNRCRGMSLFTAGLLHDIGQLVMFNLHPDRSRIALQNHVRSEQESSICDFERDVFGFDHTEIGEALAQRWKFPETLRLAIRHHHCSYSSDNHHDIAMMIGVANSVAVLAELDSSCFADAPNIEDSVRHELNLNDEMLLEAATVAKKEAEELLQLFVH